MTLEYLTAISPLLVSTILLIIVIYRIRSISLVSEPIAAQPTQITSDYTSLLAELTTLRLRRDSLRDTIAKIYELATQGKIDDNVKRMILDKVTRDLNQVEKRLSYLEKFEELNRLIRERRALEKEYKRKIEEIDSKISKLRRVVGALTMEKKIEGKKEGKVEKGAEKTVKRKIRDLSEVMEEITRLLKEGE